jgi:hypothetical protein
MLRAPPLLSAWALIDAPTDELKDSALAERSWFI